MAGGERHFETDAGGIGGQGLAYHAHRHHGGGNPHNGAAVEEQSQIDEHAHTDKEVGDEDGIAGKLDAVHERREARYVAVQNQAREEGTEDALQTYGLGEGGAEEEFGHDEDKLHHGVGVAAQELAGDTGYDKYHAGAEGGHLEEEHGPEPPMGVGIERGGDTGQHHQCDKESQHGGAHAQCHAAVALQAVAHGDGVGYQCVRRHDAAEQQ